VFTFEPTFRDFASANNARSVVTLPQKKNPASSCDAFASSSAPLISLRP
jgi:hypothetical protein